MPKKILLADDSITIQKVVELTFSDGDYEVIATNNGAKAIEEIPKVMPDLILSDIIMPEKNGYEVCEWVKSHPEHRTIPVILLTGTFEPFDPDRAEKAGCDAVVTKPFESQSLIQKVEELIGGAAAEEDTGFEDEGDDEYETPPTELQHPVLEAPPEKLEDDEPVFEEPAQEPAEAPAPEVPPMEEPSAETPQMEVEGEEEPPPPPPPSFEMGEPSAEESPAFEGVSEAPPPPPAEESSPFPAETEEPKPQGDVFGSEVQPEGQPMEDNETKMIPKMSMEDIQRMKQEEEAGPEPAAEQPQAAPPPPPEPEPAAPEMPESPPFESAPAEQAPEDSETKMIPKMSMEEVQDLQGEQEQAAPPFGGEEPSAETEPPASEEEAFEDTSTRMIPKSSFEQPLDEEAAEAAETEAPEAIEAPGLGMGAPSSEETAAPNPFEQQEPEGTSPAQEEDAPFTEPPPEPIPAPALPPDQPVSEEPEEAAAEPAASGELTEEQIDRIARRVVELISDKAVREIAWEVIPETAEMVVRERIRELEGEEA